MVASCFLCSRCKTSTSVAPHDPWVDNNRNTEALVDQAWNLPAYFTNDIELLLCQTCGRLEQSQHLIEWVQVEEPTGLQCSHCNQGEPFIALMPSSRLRLAHYWSSMQSRRKLSSGRVLEASRAHSV